jgi:hypothetical protein
LIYATGGIFNLQGVHLDLKKSWENPATAPLMKLSGAKNLEEHIETYNQKYGQLMKTHSIPDHIYAHLIKKYVLFKS